MKRPSTDELETAIMWLETNDGVEGGEADSCKRVARWLIHQERERVVRAIARRHRAPVARVREAVAARDAKQQTAGDQGRA